MTAATTPPADDALDRIDRRILRELQADGRISNADLAKRINLSAAACHRRVARLVEDGYISRFTALIDPARVDLGVLVHVGVVLDRSTPESFGNFETSVLEIAAILECHLVAGDFDYFLKIRARDLDDFNRFHGETLLGLPGVRQTRTFFVMKDVRSNGDLVI